MCHKYIIHYFFFKYNYYLPIFRLNLNNLKPIYSIIKITFDDYRTYKIYDK